MKNVNVVKKIKKTSNGAVEFLKKVVAVIAISSAIGAAIATLTIVLILNAI